MLIKGFICLPARARLLGAAREACLAVDARFTRRMSHYNCRLRVKRSEVRIIGLSAADVGEIYGGSRERCKEANIPAALH